MNNSIIPKRFWWIAAILILLPPAIGMCYWISYKQFPIIEWGAVSTWYVGLFSIWLLYRTLVAQQLANNNNLSDQVLTQLRERILYLLKIYKLNASSISGHFIFLSSHNEIKHENGIGDRWFELARWELSYIKNTLKLKNPPEEIETADSIYHGYIQAFERDDTPYYKIDPEKEAQRSKEYQRITLEYFESLFADHCDIQKDWWTKGKNNSEEEINAEIRRIFVRNHPECILIFNLLNSALQDINNKRIKYKSLSMDEEFVSIAHIIEASLSVSERLFYREFSKFSPKLKQLFEETNFMNQSTKK